MALREEHNGYRIEGRATFLSQGEVFQRIKRRFAWARAAVLLEVQKYEKLLAEESAAGYLASHPEVRTPSGSAIWPE